MPNTPLPNVMFAFTLQDAYALYAAGVADGSGESAPTITHAPLAALLTTLRGRYLEEHGDELLAALPDGIEWVKAQQTLKERTI